MSEQTVYCGQCSDVHGVAVFHDGFHHKTANPDSEIANLEWRVVEAAVAWHQDERGFFGKSATPLYDAVAALIAAREEVENGSSR